MMSGDSIQLAFIGPGGPEFLLVMLVLLVMFGAKDAPRILRKLNEIINSVRHTANSFKREVMYSDLYNDTAPQEKPDETSDGHDEDYDYGSDYDDGCDYGTGAGSEAEEESVLPDRKESLKQADGDAEPQEPADEGSDDRRD